MCGIAGWSWRNPPPKSVRRTLACGLGTANDARGGKGYGVFDAVRQTVRKGPQTMTWFIGTHGLDWAHCMRGFLHTRMPSTGDVKAENSHPFTFGPVTGAHNGIVSNHAALNDKYGRKFEVDSMHIFAHLAEGRSLDDLYGYGTVEWFDVRDGRLRLLAFNSGSLCVYRFTAKKAGAKEDEVFGVAWSSTAPHLEDAIKRAGLWEPAQPVRIDDEQVYDVTCGEIYHCPKFKKLKAGSYARSYSHKRSGSGSGYAGVTPMSSGPATLYTAPNPVRSRVDCCEWRDGVQGTKTVVTTSDGDRYAYWEPVRTPPTLPGIALHHVTTRTPTADVKAYLTPGDYRDKDGNAACVKCHKTYKECHCREGVGQGFCIHLPPYPEPVEIERAYPTLADRAAALREAAENSADAASASATNWVSENSTASAAQPGQESGGDPGDDPDEKPTLLPAVAAVADEFLDPVIEEASISLDPEAIEALVEEVVAAVSGLDPRSQWYPLAESGFFDPRGNPVPWWQVGNFHFLCRKNDTIIDRATVLSIYDQSSDQEEFEALEEIRWKFYGVDSDEDLVDDDTPLYLAGETTVTEEEAAAGTEAAAAGALPTDVVPTPRSVTEARTPAGIADSLPVPQTPRPAVEVN